EGDTSRCQIGLEANGLGEVRHRFFGLALAVKRVTEVVAGLGVAWFETHGFAVMGDSVVRAPGKKEGDAEVYVGVSIVRFEFQGGGVMGDGFAHFSLLGE